MAFDFIKYFYSVENQKKWAKANCMPVRTDVFKDEAIKSMPAYDEMQMWGRICENGIHRLFPVGLFRAIYETCASCSDRGVQRGLMRKRLSMKSLIGIMTKNR